MVNEADAKDWLEDAARRLEFIGDEDATALILFRFEAQYLPAVRAARSPDQLFRSWSSFHYYMTTRATRRKPFNLSYPDADRVVEALTDLLSLPPFEAAAPPQC